MKECEDCGEQCQRRWRCNLCGLMVCPFCRNHIHNEAVQHVAAPKPTQERKTGAT